MNQMTMNGAAMPNGVAGGMTAMTPGVNGATPNPQTDENDYKTKLNTYIYDYLIRNEQYESARALLQSTLRVSTRPPVKKRPGVDSDAMDTDSKDDLDPKRPADLPLPASIIEAVTENSFLLDWFTLFWEIFLAPRGKRPPTLNPNAVSYASHIRDQSKLRQEAQSNFLRQPNMSANMQQFNMMRMQNAMPGRMPQGMANAQNLTQQQQRMLAQRQIMQQQHQSQMERGGSDMDMNGQRPRTPSAMMPGMENIPDFYANGPMRQGIPQNPGTAGGNHALQDYQMQLMLLEQQNKKRLLMARQEQDNMRPDGANMGGGQQAFTAPGMSPQGSRSGPSPSPSDQMKRGTPKPNRAGLPGSPMPDGTMQRGSPGAMNFNNGSVPTEMMQQAMNGKMGEMAVGPNGVQMRVPSSHPQFASQMQQMGQLRQAQANGLSSNGANWQQGPQGQGMMALQAAQMQQPGQPQPQQQPPQPGQPQGQQPPNQQGQGQMGTPQPRNAMPPPQNVPTAANAANARPASPAQSAASTTPQQSNKPNPKKKDKQETRKRINKKNATAAATPSADGENPPPTPTGQTPITPMNKSFNEQQKAGQQPSSAAGAAAPAAAPAAPVAQPQPDPNLMNGFPDMEGNIGSDVNMDFVTDMDAGDVLNTFDFDAFLQEDNGNQEFNIDAFGSYDGLDTGES